MLDTAEATSSAEVCAQLRAGYLAARRHGATRHRDIAAQLGVSEAELLAAHVAPTSADQRLQVQRLRGPWPGLIEGLEGVGTVMALTRNASCVHEKIGVYSGCSSQGPAGREMGLVLGTEIDLRVFYSHWAHGFAVHEQGERGLQQSLQFFDAHGNAVHKVFVQPGTERDVWAALVRAHCSELQVPGLVVTPAAAGRAEIDDAQVDVPAFREGWAGLRDTHDFFGLLRRHGLARTQALRLADPAYAQRVETSAARDLLQAAARDALPVMVFVGNPGTIQIHTGAVQRVEVMGPWLNVLDRHFNLHLREDHIVQAWAVRKPTSDGLVSSLEFFDAEGETIAMFFGERKPGRPELCAWRRLVDGMVSAPEWQPLPRRVRGMLSRRHCLAAALCAAPFSALRAQPSAARRIVAVGGAITETIYALGAQNELVGVDNTSLFPAEATRLPSVGYARALSAEGLLSLRPTLVLAGAEAGPPTVLRQLQAAGVPLVTLDAEHRFEQVLTRTRRTAELLARDAAGQALAAQMQQAWQAATARVAALCGSHEGPRVLFVLSHAMNQVRIGGRDTAADAMIRYAGARNALAEVQGFKPLTPEAAIAAAPDIILGTEQGLAAAGGVDGLLAAPGLAATPAGRARRVVALEALFMLGFGPRLPQAVVQLAERLHGPTKA